MIGHILQMITVTALNGEERFPNGGARLPDLINGVPIDRWPFISSYYLGG